jgi:hypothetical protein
MASPFLRYFGKSGLKRGRGIFASISGALALVRFLQKVSGTGPKTLYTHELEPGQVLIVTETRPRK